MRGLDLRGLALTLVLGAIGGIAAHAAHLPLGYLLGSMVLVGTLAGMTCCARPALPRGGVRVATVATVSMAFATLVCGVGKALGAVGSGRWTLTATAVSSAASAGTRRDP